MVFYYKKALDNSSKKYYIVTIEKTRAHSNLSGEKCTQALELLGGYLNEQVHTTFLFYCGAVMNTIHDAINFVKSQADYQDSRSSHFDSQGDEVRARAYQSRSQEFSNLLKFIEDNCESNSVSNSIYITPEDLIGLPEEVIKELNISESDRHEFFIMRIIEKLGGVASIDKIIIGAYRDSKEILERQKLNAKLYRMSSKGLIYSHPNKKGVYSIKEVKGEMEDSDWLEEL